MITKNMISLMGMIPEAHNSSSGACGITPIRDVRGVNLFCPAIFYFPSSVTQQATFNPTNPGISIGSGNTPATENDYQLESTIIGGVNITLNRWSANKVDESGYPCISYFMTVTNTGEESISISEIGYKQTLYGTKYPGSYSYSYYVCLLDRTVFTNPLVLSPGDAGTITYKLKTNPYGVKIVNGVKCVNFTWGTDEEISTCIDAARNGLINLQTDCGWCVGDMRVINIGEWTTGSGTVIEPIKTVIAITQFGDYNNSGSLFQFDFIVGCCKTRMNSSNTNAGGYENSEMYTTTIPALVNALPSWLRTRLKQFSVLVANGGSQAGTTVVSVSGNKLALRSEIEIFGTTSYSYSGEGTQIDYYKIINDNRKKNEAYPDGNGAAWWERSPGKSFNSHFCFTNSDGTANANGATASCTLTPFGCI